MALANSSWERPVPTTAGISVLRLPSPQALEYTNGEKRCWKDPWEKLWGKACPSRLSKYPASSHQGASGRSLNSLKVPFICSKSRIVFVQGLLFLDKSLAPIQALDCVRMFHRPQQEALLNESFQRDPFLVTRIPNSSPERLCSAVWHGSDRHHILISTPIFLEEDPHTHHKIVLSWSTLFSASYHITDSFPVEQAGKTFFPCLSICLVAN